LSRLQIAENVWDLKFDTELMSLTYTSIFFVIKLIKNLNQS
jgi:hypothetical protein